MMMATGDEIKLPLTSRDVHAERLAQFRELFPEASTEGKFDLKKLAQLLGDAATDAPERYGLSWAGKSEAIRAIQSVSPGTLLPVPGESVNFDTTENLIIEGDNLEVLKLLQGGYHGRVKMIYIDPPYNTGGEFIYPDNYKEGLADYLKFSGQVSGEGVRLTTNAETDGRYHSKWLTMMYPRLFLARNLLRDDGVIFVSIDDHEVHNLRAMMNEIFGEENFVATFVWKRRASSALAEKLVSVDHEYVVAYHKGSLGCFAGIGKGYESYSNPDNDPNGDWTLGDLTVGMTREQRPNQFYDLVDPKTGRRFSANPNRVWAFIPESMSAEIAEGRVMFPDDSESRPMLKRYRKNLKSEVNPVSTWIRGRSETPVPDEDGAISLQTGLNSEGTRSIQELFETTIFNYSKPPSLLRGLLQQVANDNDITLDFFAGSGTTAQAVLELNAQDGGDRKFILVQLPEPTDRKDFPTIADITKERVRRVIKKLETGRKEAQKAQKKEKEGSLFAPSAPFCGEPDLGFKVFKLSSSNFKVWDAASAPKDAAGLAEQLKLMAHNVVENRGDEALLYELILKSNLPLGHWPSAWSGNLRRKPCAASWRASRRASSAWTSPSPATTSSRPTRSWK
jgi:adenine-specific DNA-methyltransferase